MIWTTSSMTSLSRIMLPSTPRSASRLKGGKRSGLPCSAMLLLLRLLQRHHHDLDVGFDLVADGQVNLVEAAQFDRPFELDHFRLDLEVFALERLGDFGQKPQ